ncbi:hypothetical protein QE152_g15238 [Popillia japonica]|uniref:Uncharacterized protein n=1 Tax=Popillia japonica TaxID=7064 RepID=A0AAW1L961_POPJA
MQKNINKSSQNEERKVTSNENGQGTANQNKETNNIPQVDVTQEEEAFSVVTKKRRSRNLNDKVVRGSGSGMTLKGVTTYRYFHICGLDPETMNEEVIKHLKEHNFRDIKCEKLLSKRPEEYSSFKVAVPVEESISFENPEIWPYGVRINKYFFHQFRRKATPS